MSILKKIEKIRSSLSESMGFIPKEVYVAFWLCSFLRMLGLGIYVIYLDYIAFFIMSVLITNYYLKQLSYKIINYADRGKPKNGTNERSGP